MGTSTILKVEHYRKQAAQLRAMAGREPENSKIRGELLELAVQYDRLAERATAGEG